MKNLRFTFRMLKRNPLMLFISIPGLAVGLCAFLLLAVYLKYEFSFDQHFANKDRVLRLYNRAYEPNSVSTLPIALRTAYTQLPMRVPEVEKATQLYFYGKSKLKTPTRSIKDIEVVFSDPEFFDVFGINLLSGNTIESLFGKNKVVLNRTTAEKVFGNIDCVGKALKLDDLTLIVGGVAPDLPKNTHFNYDAMVSFESFPWITQQSSLEFQTYYLIKEGTDPEQAADKIAAVNNELMKPWSERVQVKVESGAELLTNIHLHTPVDSDRVPKANPMHLFITEGIAFFILLIAIINFINMYLLQGEKRIAEISSRKAAGANRKMLAKQFFTETGVIAVIALILGVILAVLTQPFFAKLIGIPLAVKDMFTHQGIMSIVSVLIMLIILTGAYPSFYLSKINMVSGLKGKRQKAGHHSGLSRAVVLVQFFTTILLISSLIIIRSQINHLKHVPLGFNPERVVAVTDFNNNTGKNITELKKELKKLPFIESIGTSDHFMGGGCSGQSLKEFGTEKSWAIDQYRVQPGFCETMQLQLVNGRFFNEEEKDKNSIILNESAVKMMGLENPIGAQFVMWSEPLEVIGVVKDFYFDGYAGEKIDPLVLSNSNRGWVLNFRTIADNFTLANQQQVTSVIKQFDPEYAMSFIRMTELYEAKFDKDEQIMKMVSAGTVIAILLSFMGLLALSIMNVARRTKEIGIRKVLGSSEIEIMRKLIYETLLWVGIASVFAFGASYILMEKWLSSFAIKIPLHIGYFLISGLFALIIVLLAVSWQSWKAATRNPVEALRYE